MALGVLQSAARAHIALIAAREELRRRKRDACGSLLRCGLRVLQAREVMKGLECRAAAAILRRYVPICNAKEVLWHLKCEAAARKIHRVYLGMQGRKRVRRTIFERKLWASKELRVYVEVMRLRMQFAQHKKSEGFHLAGKALGACRSWNTLMGYTVRHKQTRGWKNEAPPPSTVGASRTPTGDRSLSPRRIAGFSELELRAREAADNERRARLAPPKKKSFAAAALLGDTSPRMSAMQVAAVLGPRFGGDTSPRRMSALQVANVLGPRLNVSNAGGNTAPSPRAGLLTPSKSAPNGLQGALSPQQSSGPGPRFSTFSGGSTPRGSGYLTPNSTTPRPSSRPTTPRQPTSRPTTPRLGNSHSASSITPTLKMAGDHPLQAQLQNWRFLAKQEAQAMYLRGALTSLHNSSAHNSSPQVSPDQIVQQAVEPVAEPVAEPVIESFAPMASPRKLEASVEEKLTSMVSSRPAEISELPMPISADNAFARSLSPEVGPRGRWQILKQFALNCEPLASLELPTTPRTPAENAPAEIQPPRRISSLPPVPPLNLKGSGRPVDSLSHPPQPRPSPKTSAPSSAPSSARRAGAERAPVGAAKARGVAGGQPPSKVSGVVMQQPATPGSRSATPGRWR